MEKLKKLEELYRKGIITKEEVLKEFDLCELANEDFAVDYTLLKAWSKFLVECDIIE